MRTFRTEDLDHVFEEQDWYDARFEASKQAWESGVHLPLDGKPHRELAQNFLDSGAEDNLQAITVCAQDLRKQIEKHFTLTDVLLKVNDTRSVTTDPSRILWGTHDIMYD